MVVWSGAIYFPFALCQVVWDLFKYLWLIEWCAARVNLASCTVSRGALMDFMRDRLPEHLQIDMKKGLDHLDFVCDGPNNTT